MKRNLNEIIVATQHMVTKWEAMLQVTRKDDEVREQSHCIPFYEDLFAAFGLDGSKASKYERRVKHPKEGTKRIDVFLPAKLLVEQKSPGKSLDDAQVQALEYIPLLEHRREWPDYVLVSDFVRFRLLRMDKSQLMPVVAESWNFTLHELPKRLDLFGFLTGYQRVNFKEQPPVNRKAAELMADLHDELAATGFKGHHLEVFLVRLLFCLFADDTGLFREPDVLLDFLQDNTRPDVSDTGSKLQEFFQVLDEKENERSKVLNPILAKLPYVNGSLFSETLRMPTFTAKAHEMLLDACAFGWSEISPAVFGNLFQTVMRQTDAKKKRQLGAEYTPEHNILKVVNGLFMDELRGEFARIRNNIPKLRDFQNKLANIRVLDPACGCGNFLILAYRELRELELEVIKLLHTGVDGSIQMVSDVKLLTKVSIDQFYGFEIEEFPARIAEVAMYLVEHQANRKLHNVFGQHFEDLPLTRSAHITIGNALKLDWADEVPVERLSYIIGNPPFVGSKMMDAAQRDEILAIFPKVKGNGILDFVTGWYGKAATLMRQTPAIKTAFVSTNSICQGEQVAVLWGHLLGQGMRIHFAHRTFAWTSDAKGKAAVYCIIVGFGVGRAVQPMLYDYPDLKGQPIARAVKNISPYLAEGGDVVVTKLTKPLCDVPPIVFGSMANDGGGLILNEEEKEALLLEDTRVGAFIRPLIGAEEFINGTIRWCLWLKDVSPSAFRGIKGIMERLERVKIYRLASTRATTRELANTPALFGEIRQPVNTSYICIPSVSAERRDYIPMAFLDSHTIASNLCLIIPNAIPYHLGVLTSTMHMVWVKNFAGKLGFNWRYSNQLCYNPYPWPTPTKGQEEKIAELAGRVLEARAVHPDATLADLYDPLTMPANLRKAHTELDKAVDAAYRKEPFGSEAERVAFLLGLYQQLTMAPLEAGMVVKPKRMRKVK